MSYKKYSSQDKKLIAENAMTLSAEELGSLLDRSPGAIRAYLFSWDIPCKKRSLGAKRKKLTKTKQRFIMDNHKTMNVTRMAEAIKESYALVCRFVEDNNLERNRDYTKKPATKIKQAQATAERKKIIHFNFKEPRPIQRPPAIYSNPDWSRRYMNG